MTNKKSFTGFNARIIFFIVFFLCAVNEIVFSASPVAEQFAKASQLYKNGKYDDAVKAYEEIAKEKPAAEVYYNLGNAYFKTKKIGLAILNYERARRQMPRDSDILANLAYVNQLIEYKIDDKANWYLRKKSELLSLVTFSEAGLCLASIMKVTLATVAISLCSVKPS